MTKLQLELYQAELEVQNQELRASRELLEDTLDVYSGLYDYAALPCLTLDVQGRIQDINLTGARLLNADRDKLVGLPFARLLDAGSLAGFFSHLQKCGHGEERVVSRLRLSPGRHSSGEVILLSQLTPLEDFTDSRARTAGGLYQSSLVALDGLFLEACGTRARA